MALWREARLFDAVGDKIVVAVVDDGFAFVETSAFQQFLVEMEVLLMGFAYVGDDTDGGLNDLLQTFHLVRLGNAGFEDAELCLSLSCQMDSGTPIWELPAAR